MSGAPCKASFAAMSETLGFITVPNKTESRHDIIQAVTIGISRGCDRDCAVVFRQHHR